MPAGSLPIGTSKCNKHHLRAVIGVLYQNAGSNVVKARRAATLSVAVLLCVPLWSVATQALAADAEAPADKMSARTFAGLKLRQIGPAVISGRVVAIAEDSSDRAHYYVGAASGGVWETKNDGGTWMPVFDHEGSFPSARLPLIRRTRQSFGSARGQSFRFPDYVEIARSVRAIVSLHTTAGCG